MTPLDILAIFSPRHAIASFLSHKTPLFLQFGRAGAVLGSRHDSCTRPVQHMEIIHYRAARANSGGYGWFASSSADDHLGTSAPMSRGGHSACLSAFPQEACNPLPDKALSYLGDLWQAANPGTCHSRLGLRFACSVERLAPVHRTEALGEVVTERVLASCEAVFCGLSRKYHWSPIFNTSRCASNSD